MAGQIAVRAYAAEAARDKFVGHGAGLRGPVLQRQPAPGEQMLRRGLDDGAQVRQRILTRGQRLPGLILRASSAGSRAST